MISVLLFLLLVFTTYAVVSKKLIRSVISLGGTGVVIGLIFISFGANLLGVFQVAIYAGITAVLVFVISMLKGD